MSYQEVRYLKLSGRCSGCNSPVYWDGDKERCVFTSDDPDCMCEIEKSGEEESRRNDYTCEDCGETDEKTVRYREFCDRVLCDECDERRWEMMEEKE